jgi:hypothetical protein
MSHIGKEHLLKMPEKYSWRLFVPGASLLFILMFSAVFLIGFSKQEKPGDGISFVVTEHDFGVVTDASALGCRFFFRNASSKPLEISRVVGTCGCTTALIDKNVYGPGEEGSVEVEFNPAGTSGRLENTVYVETNSQQEPLIALRVSATVIKSVSAVPPIVDFGKIEHTSRGERRTVEIRTRERNVTIQSIHTRTKYILASEISREDLDASANDGYGQLFRIEIVVNADDLPSRFADRVTVRFSSPAVLDLAIPVLGQCVQNIVAEPRHVIVKRPSGQSSFDCSIRIKSISGKYFRVMSADIVDADGQATSWPIQCRMEPGDTCAYVLTVNGNVAENDGVFRYVMKVIVFDEREVEVSVPFVGYSRRNGI